MYTRWAAGGNQPRPMLYVMFSGCTWNAAMAGTPSRRAIRSAARPSGHGWYTWTTSAPVIAATSTSGTGLANMVFWRCARRLAIGSTSSGTQKISRPSGPFAVASPGSPHATTRTVCPRAMRVAANRIADTVVPLLLTLNVSMTSVMIISAPAPPFVPRTWTSLTQRMISTLSNPFRPVNAPAYWYSMDIHSVATDIHLPAGMAGPEPMDFDVRCYLVAHGAGLVLVDTGMPQTPDRIGEALTAAGAAWADVTDVVLTHAHPDHTGGLDAVGRLAPGATVWGHGGDGYGGAVRSVVEGDTVRGLRVLHTPGHTPGHICLLAEDSGVLFVGDAFGSQDGHLVRPPARFTADAAEAERSLRRIAGVTATRMLVAHGSEVDEPAAALRELLA